MSTLTVAVLGKRQETDDIVCLELGLGDGGALPPFSAGAHIDVHVNPGVVRQYSLCNHPDEQQRYVIGVLRDPASRGGSQALHDGVDVGAVLEISAPKNHFPLVRAERTLLFAGGIGVTPMLCMAEWLAHTGASFELHYCTRSPSRTAFRERIAASAFADRVHFHHDDGDAAQRMALDAVLGAPDPGTHLYVCGPRGYIDYVRDTARALGWPEMQIHVEYFGAEQGNTGGDHRFHVKIARTGQVIPIPADRSVATVLLEHGIDLHVSCEQGVCGTCVTRVLEGEPDHRDLILTEEEKSQNDQFTPCCSRAKSDLLVLDL